MSVKAGQAQKGVLRAYELATLSYRQTMSLRRRGKSEEDANGFLDIDPRLIIKVI